MSTRTQRQQPPPYAELHCLSSFSFQRGASSARELFERARKLGYTALAITDECSLAGIVRALEAAEETGVALIVGSEITLSDGTRLVLLCEDNTGYASLCRLITRARRNADKGEYRLSREELEDSRGDGLLALLVPSSTEVAAALASQRTGTLSPLDNADTQGCVALPGNATPETQHPRAPLHVSARAPAPEPRAARRLRGASPTGCRRRGYRPALRYRRGRTCADPRSSATERGLPHT